jgi:hypothetical protein
VRTSIYRFVAGGLLAVLLAGCDCNSTPAVDSGPPCPTACGKGFYCCKKSLTCETERYNCTNIQSCSSGTTLTYPPGPYMNDVTCEPLPLECTCTAGDSLKPGIIGRYSALASASGTLMASAREDSFGDLVLASVKTTALDAQPVYEIVDGVPSAQPTKSTAGWRGGIEDAGNDVGYDTDIVVNGGNPQISYRDATDRTLKFATRSGEGGWSTHVVDSPKSAKEVVGRYSSLALIGDKPAVAYLVLNIAGGAAGTFKSELRLATAQSSAPASAADWTISVVESKPMGCQNLCASSEVCVPKTGTNTGCEAKGTSCTPACATGEACVGTTCKKTLEAKAVEPPYASGLWPNVLAVSGGAVLVYHDHVEGKLKAASPGGATWKIGTVSPASTDNLGAFCSAAVDASGVIHVSYQNATRLTLHYTQVLASTLAATVTEVIDDGIRTDGPHPVGADSAILIDGGNAVRVLYQDQRTTDLLAAKRAAPNSWTPNTSADANLGRLLKGGKQGAGFYSDLTLDGGQIYGSTFYFDPNAPSETAKGGLLFFNLP